MATTGEAIAYLVRAFDRPPVTREQVDQYGAELADLPPDVLFETVRWIVRTKSDPWRPTIGEIRTAAATRTLALPTETQALAQVEALVAWGRSPESTRPPAPPTVHELVKAALTGVGGSYAFRAAEKPDVVRGQFLRLYKELHGDRIAETVYGDPEPLPALTRAPRRAELVPPGGKRAPTVS